MCTQKMDCFVVAGYGSTAPQTSAGKAAVVLYGFFGCSGNKIKQTAFLNKHRLPDLYARLAENVFYLNIFRSSVNKSHESSN